MTTLASKCVRCISGCLFIRTRFQCATFRYVKSGCNEWINRVDFINLIIMQIFSVFLSKLVNLVCIQFAVWNLQFAWGKRKYFNVPTTTVPQLKRGHASRPKSGGGSSCRPNWICHVTRCKHTQSTQTRGGITPTSVPRLILLLFLLVRRAWSGRGRADWADMQIGCRIRLAKGTLTVAELSVEGRLMAKLRLDSQRN